MKRGFFSSSSSFEMRKFCKYERINQNWIFYCLSHDIKEKWDKRNSTLYIYIYI
jgi:hypothetical protein